jgi:hypothetical protein
MNTDETWQKGEWTGFTGFTGLERMDAEVNLVNPVNPVYLGLDLICVYLCSSVVPIRF